MPTDPISFIWGVVVTAVAIIGSGLLKAASADLYKWLKGKVSPPPIEPILVERSFQPKSSEGHSLSWVSEDKVFRLQSEGYEHYLLPENKAKCYRLVHSGNGGQFKEWLMVK